MPGIVLGLATAVLEVVLRGFLGTLGFILGGGDLRSGFVSRDHLVVLLLALSNSGGELCGLGIGTLGGCRTLRTAIVLRLFWSHWRGRRRRRMDRRRRGGRWWRVLPTHGSTGRW